MASPARSLDYGMNILADGSSPEIDIIAVQGLGAHPEWTWKSGKGEQTTLWLRDFLKLDFPNARISSWGYNSRFRGEAVIVNLEGIAGDLLNALFHHRKTEEQQKMPIVFIAHSFGGLVVKQALVTAHMMSTEEDFQKLKDSTAGIIFLGTPHSGAPDAGALLNIVTVAEKLGAGWYSGLLRTLVSNSRELRTLSTNFRGISSSMQLVCFYETKPTSYSEGILALIIQYFVSSALVVEQQSASIEQNGVRNLSLDCNHSQMNKFSSPQDPNYVKILLELKQIVDQALVHSEAKDPLKPMKVVCVALKNVLERAKNIEQLDEGWNDLIKRLKSHLSNVENHINKLEEDQRIDGKPPLLSSAIIQALDTYKRELNEVYQLLCDNRPNELSRAKVDDAFQTYTIALQQFVESTVNLMGQELPQPESEAEVKAAAYPDRLPSAFGAQHGLCLKGTRKKTLNAIRQWANDESTQDWMFCLLDVAGSGKSTVAKHMAEKWRRERRLVARFFFSRDTTETMSTNLFCSTVADAFATLDPDFKVQMDEFKARPDFRHLSFEDQFEGLIAAPLRELDRRAILTIDALDECDNSHNSRDDLLDSLHNKLHSTFRIFVTGRPEPDIKRWAGKVGVDVKNFDQLEGRNSDVELYIRSKLHDRLPNAQDRVYPIIRQAEGLFIWARIACDLLMNTDDIEGLLETFGGDVSLDYLYEVALKQSTPKDERSKRAMLIVLQMILAASRPLSIAELEKLSPWSGDVVERIVTRLGSLLVYQGREDPIRLLHTTIREFLTTRLKAGIYFIQPELGHYALASGCMNILDHQSKQESSKLSEFDGISQRTFEYASSSWAHHCTTSYRKLALNEQILEFASNRLKTWIHFIRQQDFYPCIEGVLSLSRQAMSPKITETLVYQSLEQIDTEIHRLEVPANASGRLIPAADGVPARSCSQEEEEGEEEIELIELIREKEWKELKKQFEQLKKELEDESR